MIPAKFRGYDGEFRLEDWLFKVEEYLELEEIDNNHVVVRVVGSVLDEGATT